MYGWAADKTFFFVADEFKGAEEPEGMKKTTQRQKIGEQK